jgi:hypothetical protein
MAPPIPSLGRAVSAVINTTARKDLIDVPQRKKRRRSRWRAALRSLSRFARRKKNEPPVGLAAHREQATRGRRAVLAVYSTPAERATKHGDEADGSDAAPSAYGVETGLSGHGDGSV